MDPIQKAVPPVCGGAQLNYKAIPIFGNIKSDLVSQKRASFVFVAAFLFPNLAGKIKSAFGGQTSFVFVLCFFSFQD